MISSRARSPLWILAALLAAAVVGFLLLDRRPPESGPLEGEGPEPVPESGAPDPLQADDAGGASGGGADAEAGGPSDAGAAALHVSGVVVDERERGIGGATVEVFPIDPRGLRGAPYRDGERLGATRTEADGRFRLAAPARTWLRVVGSAPGRATVGLRVASTGARIVLRLPPASRLVLHVRTEEDRPVAGARVDTQVDETRATAESAADGTARFDALPPGNAWVTAGAEGHATVRAGPFALTPTAVHEATVVLTPAVRLAGTVVDDADGSPLAGARVIVARPGASTTAEPTGADGRFGPLHAGGRDERVFASVTADGFAPLLEPVILQGPGVQTVVLRLSRSEPWRGTVRRADGRPAAGARVAYGDDGVAGRTPAATVTDEEGRFALPPPPPPAPGRRVVLYARGADGTAALGLRPGMLRPEPLVLTLSTGVRVSGRVVGPDGRGLGGVQVRLTPAWGRIVRRPNPDPATSLLLLANEQGFVDLAAASAADGSWTMDAVPPGPYEVRYRWAGGRHWREDVLEVEAPVAQAGTETLGAGFALAGRLVDGRGRPVVGAHVRVVDTEARGRARQATSDPDGHYELRGLPAATYGVRASYGALEPVEIVVPLAADTFDADLAFADGAVLAGRVVTEDATYAGLLSVSLRAAAGGAATRPPHHLRVRAGAFRWEDAPPGEWIVEGRAPGGLLARGPVPVTLEAGRVADVDLALLPEGALSGTLQTAGGKPAASARVTLTSIGTGRRRLGSTDASGRFLFSGLPAGAYRLEAWGRGGAPVRQDVDLAAGEQREQPLALAPGGAVRIEVRDARDRPVAGAVVIFRADDGVVPSLRPDRTARDGTVLRDDLPVGDVALRVRSADGREGRTRVTVEAGRTVEVRIRVATPPR